MPTSLVQEIADGAPPSQPNAENTEQQDPEGADRLPTDSTILGGSINAANQIGFEDKVLGGPVTEEDVEYFANHTESRWQRFMQVHDNVEVLKDGKVYKIEDQIVRIRNFSASPIEAIGAFFEMGVGAAPTGVYLNHQNADGSGTGLIATEEIPGGDLGTQLIASRGRSVTLARDYQTRIGEAKEILLREEHGLRLEQPLPPGVDTLSDKDTLQSKAEIHLRQDHDRRIAAIKVDGLEECRTPTADVCARDAPDRPQAKIQSRVQ